MSANPTISVFDYSANASAIPFGSYVLLATIPPTGNRKYAEIQNQSADPVQVVRDDGSGGQASSILIASGGGAGVQGGGWSTTTFRGRIRVYGVAGSQVSVFQE